MDSFKSLARDSLSHLVGSSDKGKSDSSPHNATPQAVRTSITDLLQHHYPTSSLPANSLDLTDNSSSAEEDDEASFFETDNSSEAEEDDPDPDDKTKAVVRVTRAYSGSREMDTDNSSEEAEDDDGPLGDETDNSSEAGEDDELDPLSELARAKSTQKGSRRRGESHGSTLPRFRTVKPQHKSPLGAYRKLHASEGKLAKAPRKTPEKTSKLKNVPLDIDRRTSTGYSHRKDIRVEQDLSTLNLRTTRIPNMSERREDFTGMDTRRSGTKSSTRSATTFVVSKHAIRSKQEETEVERTITAETSRPKSRTSTSHSVDRASDKVKTLHPSSSGVKEDGKVMKPERVGVIQPKTSKMNQMTTGGVRARASNSKPPKDDELEVFDEYQKAIEQGLRGQVELTRPTLLQVVAKAGLWSSIGIVISRATHVERLVLKTKDEYSICSSLNLPYRRIVFGQLRRALFDTLNISATEAEYRKCRVGHSEALRFFSSAVIEWDQQRTQEFLKQLGAECDVYVDGSDLLDAKAPEDMHDLGLTSHFQQQRFKYQLALYRIRQDRLRFGKINAEAVTDAVSSRNHAWTMDDEAGLRAIKPVREWTNDDVVDLCSSLGLPASVLTRIQEFALVGEDLEGLTPELAKDELLVSDLEDRQALLAAIKLVSKQNGVSLGRCEYFDVSYYTQDRETHCHFQQLAPSKRIICFHPLRRQCIRFHPRKLFSNVLQASAKRVQVNARVWYRILEIRRDVKHESKKTADRNLKGIQTKGAFAVCNRASSFAVVYSQIAHDSEKILRWDPLYEFADTETEVVNGWKYACQYEATETTDALPFKSRILPVTFKRSSSKRSFFRFCFMVDFTSGQRGRKRIGNNLFFLSSPFLVKPLRVSTKITTRAQNRLPMPTSKKLSPQSRHRRRIVQLEECSEGQAPQGLARAEIPLHNKEDLLKDVPQGSRKDVPPAEKLGERLSVAYHLGRLGTREKHSLNDTAEEVQLQLNFLTADVSGRCSGYISEESSTSDDGESSDLSSVEMPPESDIGEARIKSWAERVKGFWKLPPSEQSQLTYPYRPSHQNRKTRVHETNAVIELVSKLEPDGLDRFFEILSTYDLSFKGSIPISSFYDAGLDMGLDRCRWTRHGVCSYWGCTSIKYELAVLNLDLKNKEATEKKVVRQVLDRLRCRGNFMGVNLDDWYLTTSMDGDIALAQPNWHNFMSSVQLSCQDELIELICSKASLEDLTQPLMESYQDALAMLRRAFPKGGSLVQNLGRKFEERDAESCGALCATTFLNVVKFALEDSQTHQSPAVTHDTLLGLALKFGCATSQVSEFAEHRNRPKQSILYGDFIGKILLDPACQKELYIRRLLRLDLPRLFLHEDIHGIGHVDAHLVLSPPFSKAELHFLGLSAKCKYSSWCMENVSEASNVKELERMEFDRVKRYVNSKNGTMSRQWSTPEGFVQTVLSKLGPIDLNMSGYVHLSQLEHVLTLLVPNLCGDLLFREYKHSNQSKVNYEELLLSLCGSDHIPQAQREIVSRLFALLLERERIDFCDLVKRLESLELLEAVPRQARTSVLRGAFPRAGEIFSRILYRLGFVKEEYISFDALLYSCVAESDRSDLEAEIAKSKVRSWKKYLANRGKKALDILGREDKSRRGSLKLDTFAFLFQEQGISWSVRELVSLSSVSNAIVDYETLLLSSGPLECERQAIGRQVLKRNGILTFDSRNQSFRELGFKRQDERKMELVLQEEHFAWKTVPRELSIKADPSIFGMFLSIDGDLDGWISFRSFMVTLSQNHLLREYGNDTLRQLSKTCSISTRQQTVVRYEYFCEDVSGVSRTQYMQQRLVLKACTQSGESKVDFFLRNFAKENPSLRLQRDWLLREESRELHQFGQLLNQRDLNLTDNFE